MLLQRIDIQFNALFFLLFILGNMSNMLRIAGK